MRTYLSTRWLLSGILTLFVLLLLIVAQIQPSQADPFPLPVTPVALPSTTHLAVITNDIKNNNLSVIAYPLGPMGLPQTTIGLPLFDMPINQQCQPYDMVASPDSRFLVLQFGCYESAFVLLLSLNTQPIGAKSLSNTLFLNWSPDSKWLLVKQIDTESIWLMPTAQGKGVELSLPAEVYDVAFTPEGQHLLYASSKGLGFGSVLGAFDLTNGEMSIWQEIPDWILSYPVWSPDGQYLAYILMPDTSTPFSVGELWLADRQGQPLKRLAEGVDTGHGYAPVWAPDGQSLVYVYRQNADDPLADRNPLALHSNLYQVEIGTGEIMPLSSFTATIVYDPVWLPDGTQLTFTVQDQVWLSSPGSVPMPVGPAGISSRFPAWLSLPELPSPD
ncbi:MAG: PD40 domain-containing protein [Chloroflexi bacterium]|nr:PD40 domain-containing protein [Chloroflexota bacterium]MBP8058008.1 PD40 domain-containing protein [Chloroflexota bacterium]